MGTPIRYFDRKKNKFTNEDVYGEKELRWVYQSFLGKLSLFCLVKRKVFSKFYGALMDRPKSKQKIEPFLQTYQLNEGEFAYPKESYQTFNEFFYRKLKPETRPIAEGDQTVCLPADGRHLVFPDLSQLDRFFVKGQEFNLKKFLGSQEYFERYKEGAMLFSRLCPVDYHRFHFPVSGRVGEPQLINGSLSSVSPIALRDKLSILWENKRVITEIDSAVFGKVLLIEIGATCVGGIVQTYQPNSEINRGDEKGYFRFGGSSVAVVFEKDRIRFDDDVVKYSAETVETYDVMGSKIGEA